MGRPTWDRAAPFYDLQLWLEREALRTAIELLEPRPEKRLLDLGTGTAALLRCLAERPDRPAAAVGVDASRAMLDRAGALPPGWELVRADAADLPFGDGSFDLLSAAYLLHLLDRPGRGAALVEARRVLRPGGCLVAVTAAPPRRPRLAAAVARAVELGPARHGVLAGLRPLDPRPELAAAGLTPVAVRRTYRGYPSLVVAATASGPPPPVA